LKYVFQTKDDIFIFASSATGVMEAAVANFLSPFETAVIIEGGIWGRIWSEICQGFNIKCEIIKVEEGRRLDIEILKNKLKELDGKVKAVFATLCETSTGVVFDIEAIGKVVKDTSAILIVDAAAGLGAIDFKTDAWACDVVLTGSQKGLASSPGLGIISVSPKALKLVEKSSCLRYYFDIKKALLAKEKSDTPFTPSISLIRGLIESLKIIKREGLENIFFRNRLLSQAIREGIKALGLEIFSSSDVLTSVNIPGSIDAERLVVTLQSKYNIKIARGLGNLRGKIVRIGNIGSVDEYDILILIYSLEKVLTEMGHKFKPGEGITAVQREFSK
ncbi:MAG: alanine--glyoxylate aminotransferase family protein, partial [Candidatus Omnitrophota bacterium]